MGDYAQPRATALAMLQRKGRVVVLTRASAPVNEITGKRGSSAKLTANFACVALPAGKSAEAHVGSLVGKRILEFYLSRTTGSAVDPEPGDKLVWGGVAYKLIWVAQYDPDASGVLLTKAYGER